MTSASVAAVRPDVLSIPLRELPADDDWRARAREACRAQGVTQKDLARAIGATRDESGSNSMVSQLFGQGKKRLVERSKYVERISVYLGIDLPLLARIEIDSRFMAEHDYDSLLAAYHLLHLAAEKQRGS